MKNKPLDWIALNIIVWANSCKTAEQLQICEDKINDWIVPHPQMKEWAEQNPTIQHPIITTLSDTLQIKRVELMMTPQKEVESIKALMKSIYNN